MIAIITCVYLICDWITMHFYTKYNGQRVNTMTTQTQTATRAWVVQRTLKKHKATVIMWKSFRGLKKYINCIFNIVDITLIQKV